MNRQHTHRRYLPPVESPRESLPLALVGAAAVVLWAVALWLLLTALA